jgi:hypothetical protein
MLSDPPRCFIPAFQDLMLSDINHTSLLGDVSELFEVKYLSMGPADGALQFPLFGVLYGPHWR